MQCDGCELWLHLQCIGLKPDQVSEDEDFICRDCKPPASKRPKVCTTKINWIYSSLDYMSSNYIHFNFRPPSK